MKPRSFTRREFIITGSVGSLALASCLTPGPSRPVVSIARITNGKVDDAVRHAIDLLGGIGQVMGTRKKVMLKPNLVSHDPNSTTKPAVIRALAELMIEAGREVSIGEGSAAAPGFNLDDTGIYRTSDPGILGTMQQFIFDELGYTSLAESLGIPLVNLHTGEMVEVDVPGAFVYDRITLHRSLTDIDMLCSVPMMKTHVLATVTLGMKNLIGLYPGKAYCSVRSCVHDEASAKGSPGIAYEILDMVRACPPGLVVIDGSTAMEGDGPSGGELVEANLIIAGTDPLATDMVAAHIMGFHKSEIPTFMIAIAAGMRPARLEDIDIRGEKVADVRMAFKKPGIVPWTDINSWFGAKTV